MWRLYTLHNVPRTLSYITLSKYIHYLICTLLIYQKFYRRLLQGMLPLHQSFKVMPRSHQTNAIKKSTVLVGPGSYQAQGYRGLKS
jgi:hypothetical protein